MVEQGLSSIFKHQTEPNAAILSLLENTVIGTNGAKYQHLHTAKKITELHKPHYFTIYRNQGAIANVTICERPMIVNKTLTDTFYIRYFAFKSGFQTKKKAKKKKQPAIFQKYVEKLLSTSNLNVETPEYNPKIYWAIVDPENQRSLQMGDRYGFEVISKIKTTAFSRFKLKKEAAVSRLCLEEEGAVWQQIKAFYESYNSLTSVHLFKNNYFVLKDKGEIVAGIQANPVTWRIESMPGPSGKLLTKLMPYIPFLNQIINPKKYQFLATEGLFWKAGYAHTISTLLKGVLFEQKCHSMLLWTDSNEQVVAPVLKQLRLGLLQKLKADNDVHLLAKFNEVSEKVIVSMKNQPHYISGFDCT